MNESPEQPSQRRRWATPIIWLRKISWPPKIRSLRWRLQIWHASLLAAVVLLFGLIVYLQQRHSVLRAGDDELAAAVEVLVAQLSVQEGQGGFPTEAFLGELRMPETFGGRRFMRAQDAPYFRITAADGRILHSLGVLPPDGMRLRPSRGPARSASIQFSHRGSFREAVGQGPAGMTVRVGRDMGPEMSRLQHLGLLLISGGLTVFAIGLVGGAALSRRSVQPITEISRMAGEISTHNLARKIDLGETDVELEQLAHTLNSTFARLNDAFKKQVEFTADASHELRTPLSVIQMHQELALSRARTPEEYRQTLQTCQRATERMHALVKSLLTLARLDAEPAQASPESFDVTQLAETCVSDLRPLAADKRVEVCVVGTRIDVTGNRPQWLQLLTNLISNAIIHGGEGTNVTVTMQTDSRQVIVSVQDSGPGIPPDDLPHVFDRFYRVDKQRSRVVGGSGLGLSICKSIVTAQGGTISVASELGTGTTIEVRLPG